MYTIDSRVPQMLTGPLTGAYVFNPCSRYLYVQGPSAGNPGYGSYMKRTGQATVNTAKMPVRTNLRGTKRRV